MFTLGLLIGLILGGFGGLYLLSYRLIVICTNSPERFEKVIDKIKNEIKKVCGDEGVSY